MLKISALAILIFAVAACTSMAKRLNSLEPGLSSRQVIARMGKPDSAVSAGGIKYLFYDQYCVKLVKNRVAAYGPRNEIIPQGPGTNKKKSFGKNDAEMDMKIDDLPKTPEGIPIDPD